MTPNPNGLTLSECLEARERGDVPHASAPTPNDEQLADRHLVAREYDEAATALVRCGTAEPRIRAKLAWCLGLLDRWSEGEPYTDALGQSSAELALRGIYLAGGWRRRGFNATPRTTKRDEPAAIALIEQAVAAPDAPLLAFLAYQEIVPWYNDRDRALPIAERAVAAFPALADLRVWRARILRVLGRLAPDHLVDLRAHAPAEPDGDYLGEIFDCAVTLRDESVVDDVLDTLAREPSVDLAALAIVRAGVALRRGRSAEIRASREALDALPPPADRSLERARTISLLHCALALGDSTVLGLAAARLLDLAESGDPDAGDLFNEEHVFLGTDRHGRVVIDVVDADLLAHEDAIAASLDAERRGRFLVRMILRRADIEEPREGDNEALAEFAANGLVPSLGRQIASALLRDGDKHLEIAAAHYVAWLHQSAPDQIHADDPPAGLDDLPLVALSQFCNHCLDALEAVGNEYPERVHPLFVAARHRLFEGNDSLTLKRLADASLDDSDVGTDAQFDAAVARQKLKETSEAQRRWEAYLAEHHDSHAAYRNLLLIYASIGNAEGVRALIPTLRARASADATWRETLTRAEQAEGTALKAAGDRAKREAFRAALAEFPGLVDSPVSLEALTLMQAAHLIALLRACAVDHNTWILSPFGRSPTPFDSTPHLRQALFGLARLGVLAIAESTPLGAVAFRDGEITGYHLAEVEWKVTPATFALQRAIRDRPRSMWPASWREQAAVVARDVAVEECVQYLESEAEERRLTAPVSDDARALYREMVESCSVSRCFYFTYLGLMAVNDHRSKYPVSAERLAKMTLAKIRDRFERGTAEGWAKQYRRTSKNPRTHLVSALHDVLTGWGERAFDEDLHALRIDSTPSTTRH